MNSMIGVLLAGLASMLSTGVLASSDASAADFAAAMNRAMGAGGGGELQFDGQKIPIQSVVCQLEEAAFDIGTVSPNGFRVLVTKRNRPNSRVSAQILDDRFVQWFPADRFQEHVVREGGHFTGKAVKYKNNKDERIAPVEFSIQCP